MLYSRFTPPQAPRQKLTPVQVITFWSFGELVTQNRIHVTQNNQVQHNKSSKKTKK